MQSIEIQAYAKINLALSITGKREDGYHEIDTVMQLIDLSDSVTIAKSDALCVTCDGISQEENLATRAADLFFETTGITGGATIRIEKHIPLSGGLGGGSADAAAVLKGLHTLYGADVSGEALSDMAARLGADVPFFLSGGMARARGFGEQLTDIPASTPWFYLLFREGEKPSTGEMYRRLDGIDYPKPDMDAAVRALTVGDADTFFQVAGNSFSALWEKSRWEDFLLQAGAKRVLLSGSGPTRFAVFSDEAAAQSACRGLHENGVRCVLSRPCLE